MFDVLVRETSPAGVETLTQKTYYEVTDALTVALIERRNALIPIGRVAAPFDPMRLEYVVEGRYNDKVVVSVEDHGTGAEITLRDPADYERVK